MNPGTGTRIMKTRELTSCAFSVATGVILLVYGFHLTFGEYFWYFWAAIMISVPKTAAGKGCTFIATAILSTLMCGQYLYLSSYLLWLGPYSLIWCLTVDRGSRWYVFLRYLVFYAGALIVLWTTPMLFIQLGTAPAKVRIIGACTAAVVSVPVCFGYSVLYRNMRNLLRERIISRI